jgi:hypothetical protein
MPINLNKSRQYLQEFDFVSLFVEELGWSVPPSNEATEFKFEGKIFYRQGVAELAGVMILEITSADGEIPDAKVRANLQKEISKLYLENLLIFLDGDRKQSLWYWVKREGNKQYRRDHLYVKGQSGDLFLSKLGALVVDLKDWESGNVSVLNAARRLKDSFDIDRVTKEFFKEFQSLHGDFLSEIKGKGIEDNESDRRWYASILLNRLMFVYFLQRKYFLDNGDEQYLQNKLKAIKKEGLDCFYVDFLKPLFFEGFGKPESERPEPVKKRIGKIRYLNGGLFLTHSLEQKYPDIQISDRAFEQVLSLFSRYSWNLDDTPAGKDDEINPDVLGYIFEKYINQKEFGAYYTRPEITEYLCDRTINKLILDKSERKGITNINELLLRIDADLCDRLLNQILPNLTLLDPACGSGAFLVAAMKTLIGVYTTVVSQARQFIEKPNIAKWFEEADKHTSIDYYIKKRIISDNLYGVDIMEEATEIAKLRLFLALVASAKKVNELEPLPNIDFNIMAGNSLIGLIRVDGDGFDKLSQKGKSKSLAHAPTQKNLFKPTVLQGDLLQTLAASEYQQILANKNAKIYEYKKYAFRHGDERSQDTRLLQLRSDIDTLNQESQQKLNQLLLDEFSTKLGIKYEEAQLTGKPKKRILNINDINTLEPFHWGYHFDKVFARGGFDAIITNPPWETFQPDAKEFFTKYSDLVSKKKMDVKDFEDELKRLLNDKEIETAWLEYQSKFNHQRQYFRFAEQYNNQVPVINGKRHGKDVNLYKLFLEQCLNLLRDKGECGIVIPSGIYSDLGAKKLRESLFNETQITGLFCFENRKEIFEGVHRSFKFIILTFEKGGKTESFPTRFMRHDVSELGNFPTPDDIRLDIPLIRKLSPDSLSIMEFKGDIDVQIAKKMLYHPLLGESISNTWNLELHREFNMTDDAFLFHKDKGEGMLPLYEGKMIHQFTHQFAESRYWVNEKEARQSLLKKSEHDIGQVLNYQNFRLCYRDVASSTNIRTMISTIIPPNIFTGNTLFIAKPVMELSNLVFASAILNSFPSDFLIRKKVTSHNNIFYVYQLPVPRLQKGDRWFDEIVERAAKLICTTPEFDELAQEVGLGSHKNGVTNEVERGKFRAELDGMIAHIYGLTEEEFAYILTTFPIVKEPVKQAALNAYRGFAE